MERVVSNYWLNSAPRIFPKLDHSSYKSYGSYPVAHLGLRKLTFDGRTSLPKTRPSVTYPSSRNLFLRYFDHWQTKRGRNSNEIPQTISVPLSYSNANGVSPTRTCVIYIESSPTHTRAYRSLFRRARRGTRTSSRLYRQPGSS